MVVIICYTIFFQFHIVLINFQELWPVDRCIVGPVYPIPDSFTTCCQVCQLYPFMGPTQHVIFPQYPIYSQYGEWLFSWYRLWREKWAWEVSRIYPKLTTILRCVAKQCALFLVTAEKTIQIEVMCQIKILKINSDQSKETGTIHIHFHWGYVFNFFVTSILLLKILCYE